MPILTTLGAACAKAWGFTSGLITDQYFNLVSLLLPGNGTNGAQNNTFLDGSSNNFTITRNGNTTQGTFSPFSQTGWGAYFDGSNDYLSIADNAAFTMGSGDFTIECWVFVTKSSARQSFITQVGPLGNTGDYSFSLEVNASNKVNGFVASSSTSYAATSTNNLVTNQWNHIAFVRNTNTLRLYVNGVQDGTASVTGVTVNDQSYNVGIGRAGEYNGDYMQGYISNARITKGGCLYPNGTTFTPSTTPLTTTVSAGTVSLLTCQSNRFIDNSGNTFTVTPNNGAAITPFSPFAPTQAYSAAAVGGSGYFDGTGDSVVSPSNAAFAFGTGDFQIEFFFFAQTTGSQRLVYFTVTDANQVSMGVFTNYEVTYYDGTNTRTIGTVAPNSWNHVAVAKISGAVTCWLNGTRTVNALTDGSNTSSNRAVALGGTDSGANSLNGYMSNVRILKGSTTYSGATITVPTAPLTAVSGTSLLLNFTNAGVVDATAKNDLETVGNAQISTTQSKWGGSSIYFDGTGDYLVGPSNSLFNFGSSDFTMEGWFNQTGLANSYPGIMSNPITFSAGAWSVLGSHAGTGVRKLQFYCYNYSSTAPLLLGTTTLSDNTWYYFAVTRSGSTFRLFLNGTIEATTTFAGSMTSADNGIAIGTNQVTSGFPFQGYLQDIRVTRGYARYTANFTAPTAAFPKQ